MAAAAALTLFSVAPASAATETVTTITTHSVPADVAAAIPFDYDVWGDSNYFTEGGIVDFPLEATKYDGTFTHNTFAMSAEAPEGCVRVVESFSFGYTLDEYPLVEQRWISLAGGIGTGEPFEFVSVAEGGVNHSGDGVVSDEESELEIDRARVWVDLPTTGERNPQSGVVTLSYSERVGAEEARGYIGFGNPDMTTWVVDTASFLVTDTCTSEVEIPVVPPVVVPPVVDPPVVVPPVVDPPVVVPPVVDPPVVDPPVVVPPVVVPPVVVPPVVVPPVVVPPVVVPPVVVPPVVDPPIVVPPVVDPPVVVPPVVEPPVVVPPAQSLAATGGDAGFATIAGGAAVLLLGAGAAAVLLARRRATN
ncbi:hypothetical protein [Microbacterium sp. A93]|uniref:hypothetical protein n=1 Tax=Microbacterium sp. A93 TaxID=3450716 RepID=UPI003F42BB2B